MDWNCPECGHLNDYEMIRCVCGYEIGDEKKDKFLKAIDNSGEDKPQPRIQDFDKSSSVQRPFFKRMGAFIIDLVLIGILGQVLSIGLTSQLILLGDKGPFIGLFVLLFYFGLGNSKVFNGQTIGKYVLKLAVRRLDGKKLTIPSSMLRSSIYVVPFIFNGWALDIGQSNSAKLFWVIIGSWLFSYIISLIIFTIGNWHSGRLIQDILFRTRVDQINHDTISITRKEKVLFAITACLFASFLAIGIIKSYNTEVPEDLRPIASFHQILIKEYPDFRFGVNLNHVTGEDNVNILTVRAFPRMELQKEEADHYSNVFASKALKDFPEIAAVDFLNIGITEGFHIGIARRSITSWERWSVGKWRKKLGIGGNVDQGEDKKLPFIPSMMQ